jgi:hypothetical protein
MPRAEDPRSSSTSLAASDIPLHDTTPRLGECVVGAGAGVVTVSVMVSVSQETIEETERRLKGVISAADLVVLDGVWAFRESPLEQPPTLNSDVLAVVRDEDRWSWLGPAESDAAEQFALFSFHFPPAHDNSGFVGWLATELKRRLGTGVFVICGQNTARGGIYDYWGCPVELREQARQVLDDLRGDR